MAVGLVLYGTSVHAQTPVRKRVRVNRAPSSVQSAEPARTSSRPLTRTPNRSSGQGSTGRGPAQAIPVEPAPESDALRTSAPKPMPKRDMNYYQLRPGLVVWQENIKGKTATNDANFMTRFEGLAIGSDFIRTLENPRWQRVYSLDVAFGTARGKGDTIAVPDGLRNQLWLMVGGSLGYRYRTSNFGELGISVPLVFRRINWKYHSGSDLNLERDTSFSAGLGGVYTIRLKSTSALNVGWTYQTMWRATVWNIGWEFAFM